MKTHWLTKVFSALFVFSLLLLFPLSTVHAATTYTSVMSGDWDNPATWGGGGYPISGNLDSAVISSGDTVTLTSDTTVGGDLTINSGGTLATAGHQLTLAYNFINDGTLNAGASNIVIGGTPNQNIDGFTTTGTVIFNKTGNTATFTGAVNAGGLTMNGNGGTLSLGNGLTHTITTSWTRTAGTLNGGSNTTLNYAGTTVTGTGGTFVPGTGTINYSAAGNQIVAALTYNNLTFSSSGIKTTTSSVVVNGTLSMEGTATIPAVAGAAPMFGTAGKLQYNTATARVAGVEWRTPFAATGGVVIANSGVITLSSDRVLNASVPLTVNPGASLAVGNIMLTLGGNLVNQGTLTLTSTQIVLSGNVDQSIDGFTTNDTVTMSKSSGRATFAGDITAGSLVINGVGGTLNLGTGRTHTFNGNWIMTAGTLEASNSTMNLTGNESGTGATFNAGTSTVNYSGTGGQNVGGMTYNHLIVSGSGTKSTIGNVIINGNLSVNAGATLTVQGYSFTVAGTSAVAGILSHTSLTGTKTYTGLVTITGSWFNSGNSDVHFRGGLTFSGTTFNPGNGIYYFETNNQAIGGTAAINLNRLSITGIVLTNNGNLTVNTDISGTGSLVQGNGGSTLNIAGTMSVPLDATAANNTVIYGDNANQPVLAETYYNLGTGGGTGVKTLNGDIQVNGNLAIGTGTTLTIPGFNITVVGTTTVDGSLTHSAAAGTKIYGGLVTINNTKDWVNTGNANIHFHGGLTYNGDLFTPGTGTYYFDTNDQAVGGSSLISVANLTVETINLTNNGMLTVNDLLAGNGTLTQGENATLNIAGAKTLSNLTASALNNTVNYNDAANQTVTGMTYYHLGTGGTTGVKTINEDITINGNLTVGSGTTFSIGAFDITVAGTTTVNATGILTHTSATGSKTYNGNVIIASNGTWRDNDAVIAITFAGNLQNNGNMVAGTGIHTFSGTDKTFSGNISIPNITISGTYSNNGTLTATATLAGAGSLTQGTPNPTLNIGGDITITTLTAIANPNTVRYSKDGDQTIRSMTYHNLLTASTTPSTIKMLAGPITVNGDLTIGTNTSMDVSASNHAIQLLGNWVNNGVVTAFVAQAGTVTLQGTAAQTMSGSAATTFNNLVINNAAGVILATNETINGVLTLTNGKINTGGTPCGSTSSSRAVILGTSATISGANASNYICGNLQKNFNTGPQTFIYPIGYDAAYTPLTLSFTNIATTGSMSARTYGIEHPNINTSGLDMNHDVNRYWFLVSSWATAPAYDATFTFAAGDKDAGSDFNQFNVKRNISTLSWAATTTGTRTATSTQATSLTAAGGFAIGQPDVTAPTVANVDSTKANGTYSVGVLIPVRVTFNEYIKLNGTLALTLHTAGSANRVITFSASNLVTTAVTLNYTVQTDDTSTDLDYLATNSLVLTSGTLQDMGGNDATLTLPAPGSLHSLAGNNAIVIDTVGPETTIDPPKPPSWDGDPTPTFYFSGNDGTGSGVASFRCRVDLESFAACPSPFTTATLADGPHTFYVIAVDLAGNVDATAAEYTWTIDATPPETSLYVKPPNPSNDTTPMFTFTGNDGDGSGLASFVCKMDTGSYSACVSGLSWTALADGVHTFYVAAVDNVGNVDDVTPAFYTWLVDATPPDTSMTGSLPAYDNDKTPELTFTGTDGAGSGVVSFKCKMDNGNYSACISPYPSSTLSDGLHTFYVKAVDAAGNEDAVPATYNWRVDSIPPDTVIDTKPANPDNDTTPTFTFHGTDSGSGVISYECKMDGGSFAPCTSGVTWTVLSGGTHTFYVRAIDRAGNADDLPEMYTWTIQTTVRIFLPLIIKP